MRERCSPSYVAHSRLLVAICAAAIVFSFVGFRAIGKEPANEIRAAWLPLGSHFAKDATKGSAEVKACVDRLANAHFNTLYVWMTSEYGAAVRNERYRAKEPMAAWDAVGVALREAADRGLETHLWYSLTYYKTAQSPEFDRSEGGDPSWISVAVEKSAGGKREADCCPMHAAARSWELDFVKRIVSHYPSLAGVHLEEPGYGYADRCVCAACRNAFNDIYNSPIDDEVSGERAADLKCLATTDFVRQLDQWRRQSKRHIALSANGGTNWRTERVLGRDWARWAQLGWLDSYAAQDYTNDAAEFSKQAALVVNDLHGSCPVVIGIGAKWSGGENDTKTIVQQVDLARRAGAQGVAIYHGAVLSPETLAALKAAPFLEKAVLKRKPDGHAIDERLSPAWLF